MNRVCSDTAKNLVSIGSSPNATPHNVDTRKCGLIKTFCVSLPVINVPHRTYSAQVATVFLKTLRDGSAHTIFIVKFNNGPSEGERDTVSPCRNGDSLNGIFARSSVLVSSASETQVLHLAYRWLYSSAKHPHPW